MHFIYFFLFFTIFKYFRIVLWPVVGVRHPKQCQRLVHVIRFFSLYNVKSARFLGHYQKKNPDLPHL